VLDSVPLLTRGYRADPSVEEGETRVGDLKAGTILVALDGTARGAKPCLMRVAGARDTESWKAFFATLEGAPDIVVADLDAAIARAVREAWPDTIVHHSRHHLAALLRERAITDGVPRRVRDDDPVPLAKPLPWTGERSKRWTDHPLHAAMLAALRGPDEWAAFLALVERHLPPDRLELRSWIATNEPLIRRGWAIEGRHGRPPHSSGALEGAIGEWLAPLRRRAGRWQNARRLDLVLALSTLRARGEAREARYTKLVREAFAACGDRARPHAEDTMDRWRRWKDHG